MEALRAFVRLTRPLFLSGGVLLYALGAALAEGPIDWSRYFAGQAMVTAIQLTAQYANEYFDLDADRLVGSRRTWLTGGSGVLAAGRLAPVVALRAARVTTIASLGLIGWVAISSGWAAIVGILALAGAWAYSAPPVRLVATPFGITTSSLIVAVLTPLVGGLLRGPFTDSRFLPVTLVLLLIHHAMLLAFEKPDADSDAAAGKRTLTVRVGPRVAGRLHAGLLALAYTYLAVVAVAGPLEGSGAEWALAVSPAAAAQVIAYHRAPDVVLTSLAVGVFSGTALALLLGIVWAG